MNQRGISPPIFGRRVGEKDLWHSAPRCKPLEQSVAAAGKRVSARRVIKWKGVAHRRVKRGGGLPEPLVEVAATLAAGDVDENSVEYRCVPAKW